MVECGCALELFHAQRNVKLSLTVRSCHKPFGEASLLDHVFDVYQAFHVNN